MARFRRYFWYAVGEVVLIFFGITLALWFSNWNEQRQVDQAERQTLAETRSNLQANQAHLEENIEFDRRSSEACRRVIATVEQKLPWSEAVAIDMDDCRWWSSPFLQSAAYDNLKVVGTGLIKDPELRQKIINLYEDAYAYLVNDTDKALWGFQSSVIEPVVNRYLRKTSGDKYHPNNYEELLEADEFLNMIYMKVDNMKMSIRNQSKTLEQTAAVIAAINDELASEPGR